MLIATSRKKMPWPVGSSSVVGTTSVTFSGAPCCAAIGVKTFCTTVALVSDPAVATNSSGAGRTGPASPPAPARPVDAPGESAPPGGRTPREAPCAPEPAAVPAPPEAPFSPWALPTYAPKIS